MNHKTYRGYRSAINHDTIIANTTRVQSTVVGSRSIELRYAKKGATDIRGRRHYLIIDGEWDGYTYRNRIEAGKLYAEHVAHWKANSYATS